MAIEKEIRHLVDSLGFVVEKISVRHLLLGNYSHLILKSKASGEQVYCYNLVDYKFSEFFDYKNLENELLECISAFQIGNSGQKFKNPYLNSSSLEEAMIKADLIVASS